MPNVKKIRGLNLPGTPWATSACCGRTLPFTPWMWIRIIAETCRRFFYFNTDNLFYICKLHGICTVQHLNDVYKIVVNITDTYLWYIGFKNEKPTKLSLYHGGTQKFKQWSAGFGCSIYEAEGLTSGLHKAWKLQQFLKNTKLVLLKWLINSHLFVIVISKIS